MAGFRMHVSTSALLGCGYAGVLSLGYGVPIDTAIVAGSMCGFSGMLPDLDSDHGVPLREATAFTAATIPMFLVGRLQSYGLSHDAMALIAVSIYLFVRFVVTNMIRKYTVHRGMFHSVPAMLIFAGIAFLVTGASPLDYRCFKAGGVVGGFMSHLILDEIYAVEWKGGRWRLKKSFGTAIKFWGDDPWSNFSTYAKLAIVVMLILGEPSVISRLEANNPQFAGQFNQFNQLRNKLGVFGQVAAPQNGSDAANAGPYSGYAEVAQQSPDPGGQNYYQPNASPWPVAAQSYNGQQQYQDQSYNGQSYNDQSYGNNQGPPANYDNAYDTAQRPNSQYAQ